jgi:5'-nucleotidase
LTSERHGIVSVAGLRVEARCSPTAAGESELEVALLRGGKRIAADARLRVVTSDYLATGGDRLFAAVDLEPSRLDVLPTLMRDALARQLAARKTIDGRDPALFDPKRPRLKLPRARPVHCAK